MARVIPFYVPDTFRSKVKWTPASERQVIAFPSTRTKRSAQESGCILRDTNRDRRKHPRGADVLTRIEDVTYQVLRRLESDFPCEPCLRRPSPAAR